MPHKSASSSDSEKGTMQASRDLEPLAAAINSVLSEITRDEYGSIPSAEWRALFSDFGRVLLPPAFSAKVGGLAQNDWLRLHGPNAAAASADALRTDLEELASKAIMVVKSGVGD
jgi:hypothetical protein